ncbi:phage tail sheath C-terminal domain-containing protein [Burkholderia alba]|uniref:phage tail sheath C-terminal domain-containing protein n=1 Tax=Burkholderia alba TaxID=2683677 RepID=UPI002B051FA9|nr:phage tail sheath C-terminal domain-containing protein [Burkholderia alba]
MTTDFLHGVQSTDIDDGTRAITVSSASVIGLVGTAPFADPTVFPLNTPVLIAGSQSLAAKLVSKAPAGTLDYGTLPGAVDDIFQSIGAAVVVVRVDIALDSATQRANVIGGVAADGSYTGSRAFLSSQTRLGVKPRLLIAPGFTHQRVTDGVNSIVIDNPGAGYTDGTYTMTTDAPGLGAMATASVAGGKVTTVQLASPGYGYQGGATFSLPAAAGVGTTDATFKATVGASANAVVSSMLSVARSLRAHIIADGPSTTDADAQAYAGDFGDRRIYLVDPWWTTTDARTGDTVTRPSSAAVAGLIAYVDNVRGWWWSPSNNTLNGCTGTGRAIDFAMGDSNSRANILNSQNVTTIIRYSGFRLWGNRTLSSDPKWAFLCVSRTSDIINDSLEAAHLWAVDRGITKGYVDAVIEGVSNFLRGLQAQGAILGGKCWIDPDINTAANISAGKIFFDFDFTPVFPAEEITFRSHLVNDYIAEIF